MIGNGLLRHHNVLAKLCVGSGFTFGFAYSSTNGRSPLSDAATAAGIQVDHSQTSPTTLSLRLRNWNGDA